jgi:hypothetical protein
MQRPHSQELLITEPVPDLVLLQQPFLDLENRHPGLKPHASAINDIRKGLGFDDGHILLGSESSIRNEVVELMRDQFMTPEQISQHLYNPAVPLPISAVAKSDAEIVFAKHQLQNFGILITPSFLYVQPTSLYWQLIYWELLNMWRNSISQRLLDIAKGESINVLTEDYEQLQACERAIHRRIKESYALLIEFNKKEKALLLLPDRPTVPKTPRPAKPTRQPDTPRSILKKPSKEPNNGFGDSTTIVPYQAPEAFMAKPGMKRPAPMNSALPPAKKPVTVESSQQLREALEGKQPAAPFTRYMPQQQDGTAAYTSNRSHTPALASPRGQGPASTMKTQVPPNTTVAAAESRNQLRAARMARQTVSPYTRYVPQQQNGTATHAPNGSQALSSPRGQETASTIVHNTKVPPKTTVIAETSHQLRADPMSRGTASRYTPAISIPQHH